MTHLEIVEKLIGPISPIGNSEVDAERFENLKEMCDLVNELVLELTKVAHRNRNRYESSVKRAGEYADNFLTKTLCITE